MLITLSISLGAVADTRNHVVIIKSVGSNYQQKIAEHISNQLENHEISDVIISSDEIASLPQNGKTLYVSVGDQAVKSLQEYNSDAFVLRVTSRKPSSSNDASTQSDLVTSQPDCRNIQLIKSLNPNWHTIGILSSVHSIDIAAALTKCAIRYNFNLRLYAITDKSDLLDTLKDTVKENEIILAVIDPLIYNSHSVKNILLTAYRSRKALIGYSDNFVQAGAIAAVYASPESIGKKAASVISDFYDNNWQFDNSIYTINDYSISINPQVASSLEINLPSKEFIYENISRMEAQCNK